MRRASPPEEIEIGVEEVLGRPISGNPAERIEAMEKRIALRRLTEIRSCGVSKLDMSRFPGGKVKALARHAAAARGQAIGRMVHPKGAASNALPSFRPLRLRPLLTHLESKTRAGQSFCPLHGGR